MYSTWNQLHTLHDVFQSDTDSYLAFSEIENYSNFFTTNAEFVPPKPKLLLNTVFTSVSTV